MSSTLVPFGIRQRPAAPARYLPQPPSPFVAQTLERAAQALAEPFVGLTTDGHVVPGLFPLQQTGVSTQPLVAAAERFLAGLDDAGRASACFAVDADAWRRWNNTHPFILRHGLLLETLDGQQRERALDLVRASLSQAGFQTARDVMRLNQTVGEITGSWDEYGEWLYWLSVFGTPSVDQPWGWQVDGHHLNLNCFVLGDQMVLAPMFMGAEPTWAPPGTTYAGTRVFEAEEQGGLEFVRRLSAAQRRVAVLFPSTCSTDLPPERWHPTEGRIQGRALRDNLAYPYEGLRATELSGDQRRGLLELLETYVGRLRPGHEQIKLAEVERHLDDTYFVWMGGMEEDSVFYYRVHSPVVWVEFDHLRGIALDNDEPARTHIHTVVRTPNANDYGQDLLRQHYARFHRPAYPAG
jgi:hypothetical protein